MTFEEFLKKIYNSADIPSEHWLAESFVDPETHRQKSAGQYHNDLTFCTTWSLGGTSGSCFDEPGEAKRVVSSEAEPEDSAVLEAILELFCPHVTFLQYKGITKEIMKRGETHHSDYYGGSTTEAWKGFHIEDLYNSLKKRNII